MAEYAYPEMLESTEWVVQHRHDPTVRIVESDKDILLYDVGHIPGAIKVDWQNELQHQVIRDYIDQDAFARLVGSKGLSNDHTVVFYGERLCENPVFGACGLCKLLILLGRIFEKLTFHTVSRQKQLVGLLCSLGVQDVWASGLPHYERWTAKVDR